MNSNFSAINSVCAEEKMVKLLSLLLVLVLLCTVTKASDFTVVEQRLLATLIPVGQSALNSMYESAKLYNSTLEANGVWPDISMYLIYMKR